MSGLGVAEAMFKKGIGKTAEAIEEGAAAFKSGFRESIEDARYGTKTSSGPARQVEAELLDDDVSLNLDRTMDRNARQARSVNQAKSQKAQSRGMPDDTIVTPPPPPQNGPRMLGSGRGSGELQTNLNPNFSYVGPGGQPSPNLPSIVKTGKQKAEEAAAAAGDAPGSKSLWQKAVDKHIPQYAVGGTAMFWAGSCISGNRGQQTNDQLYGQSAYGGNY